MGIKVSKSIKININYQDLNNYPGEVPNLHHEYNKKFYYFISEDFIRDYKTFLKSKYENNFTSLLIQLISKADKFNLTKLSYQYPAECMTIWMYQNIEDFHKQLEL